MARTSSDLDHETNPLYACEVNPVTGEVYSWMAFDPQYGPETQAQIDWHIKNGTPGSEQWEIGVSTRRKIVIK